MISVLSLVVLSWKISKQFRVLGKIFSKCMLLYLIDLICDTIQRIIRKINIFYADKIIFIKNKNFTKL